MRIRKAKIGDVPKIAEMAVDFMRFHANLDSYITPAKDAKKTYLEYFRKGVRSRKKLLLVAEDGEKIVGYAFAKITSRPPVSKIQKIGMIDDVYLEKKYRGAGIAAKFLNEFYAWFGKNKIDHVELSVHVKNEIGKKAWKKYGFEAFVINLRKKI